MIQILVLVLIASFFSGCKTTQPQLVNSDVIPAAAQEDGAKSIFAVADLDPKSGSQARGVAHFAKRGDDIEITILVSGATPGAHGIHLHERGDCSALDASSAGEHFNPAAVQHGEPNPQTFHMGDLGNVNVDQNGRGELKLIIPSSQFHPQYHDWSIVIGKSVVLHQKSDDLISQPAGDSGDRISCGVIRSTESL